MMQMSSCGCLCEEVVTQDQPKGRELQLATVASSTFTRAAQKPCKTTNERWSEGIACTMAELFRAHGRWFLLVITPPSNARLIET